MEEDFVRRALHSAEASEWFDWLRRELPLGGVHLPDEEDSVWLISQALHLSYRLQGVYGHLPEPLRQRMLKAAIVYQCWEQQRNLRERLRVPRRSDILPLVSATAYLHPIGKSGRHHVLEANDGCRYVVTIPTGLWTDNLPATEAICNQLARLLGLAVPTPAEVVVGAEVLRRSDMHKREHMRPRERNGSSRCLGLRFVEASGAACAQGPLRPSLRNELLGALVFDLWVANFRAGKYFVLLDEGTRSSRIVLYDHSQCLAGSWELFSRPHHVRLCPRVNLDRGDEQVIMKWLKRAKDVDFNSLWELIFEMPLVWYANRRAAVAMLLEDLSARRSSLQNEIDTMMRGVGADAAARDRKPPCDSGLRCPSGLACRLPTRFVKLTNAMSVRTILPGAVHEC